jgi:hypothetical protein
VQKGTKGGYVAVGYGRDAADVAIYNQFGPAVFPITQIVAVEQIESPGSEQTNQVANAPSTL